MTDESKVISGDKKLDLDDDPLPGRWETPSEIKVVKRLSLVKVWHNQFSAKFDQRSEV